MNCPYNPRNQRNLENVVSVHQSPPPLDIWSIVGAFLVSTISAIISILHKILRGQKFSILWLVSQYLTAIFCSYLAYDSYPILKNSLPEWVTLPMVLAIAAYTGGIALQALERSVGSIGNNFPYNPN